MNIQTLKNRVLLRPMKAEYKGLIILPPTGEKDPIIQAEVVALGLVNNDQQGRPIPWKVNPGQLVLTTDYMGAEVFHEGQRLLIMKEEDILAILE